MDYGTARNLLMRQAMLMGESSDSFLDRLQQGEPPIPGQVTSILLALKVILDALRDESYLDRELVHCLYRLAWNSRQQFEAKRRKGFTWPPLLDEDLVRIAAAVEDIFANRVH